MGPRLRVGILLLLVCGVSLGTAAQDVSTATLRGTVLDQAQQPIAEASIKLLHAETGIARATTSDAQGHYSFSLVPPGAYFIEVSAPQMATQRRPVVLEVGAEAELPITLIIATADEQITVEEQAPLIEAQNASVSTVIDEHAIRELPINGRRFSDLALLAPGVTQDPRSLTSATNGDLAFGGMRGYHSNFMVDGSDNNNPFFAQATGRYRAPFQFSNEVIQEFRVSSNTYSAEAGRSAGATINVVTKSGSNHVRGSLFYYLRDGRVNARHRFVREKAPDRQHQFGFTAGGPIRRNKMFFFGGFDQHIFHVPLYVRFLNGTSTITPGSRDYEVTDQALVEQTARELSTMGGQFRTRLIGNAAFAKVDLALSPRHQLTLRFNGSRFWGENNVFFDPASPVQFRAASENGEEMVHTAVGAASLTSAVSSRWSSHLTAQFARDMQRSETNSEDVRVRIDGVIDAFGRSAILPRTTRSHRLHLSESLRFEGRRHSFKLGGDYSQTWIENFFPLLFGGQYIFDTIRVNPFTFVPQTFGLSITPLRAYAHEVPRFYLQNFGEAVSHPNGREGALFAQETMRIGSTLALTFGLRYERQAFSREGLESNPLWPDSGKLPSDGNNFAPRVGFAYVIGERQQTVIRGGAGVFYTRIPSIYASAIHTDNGLNRTHLFLDNADFFDRQVFPQWPNPLVACASDARRCVAPAAVQGLLEREVSSFTSDFRTPSVRQASLSVEREIATRFAVSANYLFVNGRNLIRARDANLPEPVELLYPLYDESGTTFTGEYYPVFSFSNWQLTPTLACPFPPCIRTVDRPVPQLDAVTQFQTIASSEYHGLTISARRRMTRGLYFRSGYTWAKAIDNGQDGLVVGRPALVENSFAPAERSRSVTDQRHRFVLAWTVEPKPFGRDRPTLRRILHDWRLAGVLTAGSGRPINARVVGDANRDGNSDNDRLPGYSRNAFTGPDYFTSDLRLTRRIRLTERYRLEALIEGFNITNRANKRVDLSDDGFLASAAQFVATEKTAGGRIYPGHYRRQGNFLVPNNAYAPRQVQFALRLHF